MRDDQLVRGDDGLAREQGAPDVVNRGLAAADGFDDDVDVAGKEIVEAIGPDETGDLLGLPGALLAGAAITDEREFEAGE